MFCVRRVILHPLWSNPGYGPEYTHVNIYATFHVDISLYIRYTHVKNTHGNSPTIQPILRNSYRIRMGLRKVCTHLYASCA